MLCPTRTIWRLLVKIDYLLCRKKMEIVCKIPQVYIGISKKGGDIVIRKDMTLLYTRNWWFLLISCNWHSDNKITPNKTVFSQPCNLIFGTKWSKVSSQNSQTLNNGYDRCQLPTAYNMIWTVFTALSFHRPTLKEFLSALAVVQRLTGNERWRTIGMLKNSSMLLSVARQFNVPQSVISRPWNHNWPTRNVTDLPRSG